MMESLDIIKLIDSDPRFGPVGQIKPGTKRDDLKAWQKAVQTLLRTLQRPRYVATGLLPEFQQLDRSDGNPGMNMDKKLELYAEAMVKDPAPLIEELNAKLVELDDIIYSPYYCTEGGLSYDDIDLWSRLRSITIVKGVQWPTKLRAYMDNFSALGDVPLYDEMAL
jgi:glutaredoxin 2